MKYPAFLKKNGSIKLVSPSLGCNIEPYNSRLKAAINFFISEGYIINEGENIFKAFVGTNEVSYKRALEINNAFLTHDEDIIISVGGGELMTQILENVDFEILANNPKWFMGYSDNTNLTFLLTTICDVASIYGSHAGDFGLKDMPDSIKDTYSLLRGEKLSFSSYPKWEIDITKKEDPLASWKLTEDTKLINYPNIDLEFSGRLIGGCLDLLVEFIGTKFDKVKQFIDRYQSDGIIWFIEACNLDVLATRRAFIHLKRAGWLKHVKGFIIGRPRDAWGQEKFGVNQYNAIIEVIKDLNVPIIFDADIGHLNPTIPIICGSYAIVKSVNNKLTIQMKLL